MYKNLDFTKELLSPLEFRVLELLSDPEKHFTQHQMAKICNVSPSMIEHVEKRLVKLGVLEKMPRYLITEQGSLILGAMLHAAGRKQTARIMKTYTSTISKNTRDRLRRGVASPASMFMRNHAYEVAMWQK